MTTQTIKLLHLRNATYQGEIKNNKKHGKGLLITDQGQIVVGTWKNDKLSGQALVFVNPYQYGYGQFNRNELEGWFKFQSQQKIFISQFNSDRPINKQLLILKQQNSYKVTSYRKPIFEVLKQVPLNQVQKQVPVKQAISSVISQYFGSSVAYNSLSQYLSVTFPSYQLQTLPNGYTIFKYNDQTSNVALGFVFNKKEQLLSYGMYWGNKLNGMGMKIQNMIRYEGNFQAGFLNGSGLKFNNGKYSYGTFENGTLTQPIYFQQRSLASQQKLVQLKRLTHLKSLAFINIYLPFNLIKFHGLKQVIFQISLKQQYLLNSAQRSSPKKQNNIASKLLNRDDQTKSIYSATKKQKNPEEGELGKSYSGIGSLRKFKA